MAKVGKALESVLEGYASFLRERMLAPLKHQPYLVRCLAGHFDDSPLYSYRRSFECTSNHVR